MKGQVASGCRSCERKAGGGGRKRRWVGRGSSIREEESELNGFWTYI